MDPRGSRSLFSQGNGKLCVFTQNVSFNLKNACLFNKEIDARRKDIVTSTMTSSKYSAHFLFFRYYSRSRTWPASMSGLVFLKKSFIPSENAGAYMVIVPLLLDFVLRQHRIQGVAFQGIGNVAKFQASTIIFIRNHGVGCFVCCTSLSFKLRQDRRPRHSSYPTHHSYLFRGGRMFHAVTLK